MNKGKYLLKPRRAVWNDIFQDPTELLHFCDPDIHSGLMTVHKWQRKEHLRFMREWQDPLELNAVIQNDMNLRAANESGKSKFVVAPCAFFTLFWTNSLCVITSASGAQLDNQTAHYIKQLARHFNAEMSQELIKINYRKISFSLTGSEIILFATDEAGKAEGWHQRAHNSPLTLIFDEAKSIDSSIYVAASRCHDAQRFYKVSSPGEAIGGFYDSCNSKYADTTIVTAYECDHISEHQINKTIDTYGIDSPFTRSIIFAEFTDHEGFIFISASHWESVVANLTNRIYDDGIWRIGVDCAAGGDENVLDIWRGNKEIALIPFREKNTQATARRIDQELQDRGIPKNGPKLHFSLDDNGVGKGVKDGLLEKGYNVVQCVTHNAAKNKRLYANRGAELYDNFKMMFNKHILLPLSNEECEHSDLRRYQIVTRAFKMNKGKMQLEDKRAKKSKNPNYKSPDRADATVTAWHQTNHSEFILKVITSGVIKSREKQGLVKVRERAIEIYREKKYESNNLKLGMTANSSFRPKVRTRSSRFLQNLKDQEQLKNRRGLTSVHLTLKD